MNKIKDIRSLSREWINQLFQRTTEIKEQWPNISLNKNKTVCLLFWEPSTRTKLSFEHAAKKLGFKVRCNKKTDAMILSAKKGHFQKLGYFFTHLAIIVISVGGLMDANIWFIAQERLGIKNIESRDLPLSQIPMSSQLDQKNAAFRANVLLTEGEIQDVAILPLRDGYLVQDLPFRIALKDFKKI